MFRKLLKEPLVHFLFLGLLIFGYYYLVHRGNDTVDRIVIDEAEYDYLVATWKKQWQRDPTEEETRALIDQYLRQEVFYREALSMGLDHDDLIVKRRLAQKMEAVSNDLNAMITPPDDEKLEAYYHANPELFQIPAKYSFQQVLFLDREPNIQQTMKETQDALNAGREIPASLKHKLSLANAWESAPAPEIDHTFGGDFVKALDSIPTGQWSGPISTGFGQHLVSLSQKDAARLAGFHEAEALIRTEFEYRTETETQEQLYLKLLNKYRIEITANRMPAQIREHYSGQ